MNYILKILKLVLPYFLFQKLQNLYVVKKIKGEKNNLIIANNCFINLNELNYIKVGNNVFIGEGAHISAEITFGNNIMFGPRAVFIGGSHYFGVKGKSTRFLQPKHRENYEPIIIEDEVWCGACVVLPKGVRLGMGCVVGAGSVITKDIPPFTIAVGNPCKPIKKIFNDTDLFEHLLLLNYEKSFAQMIVQRRNDELKKWGLLNLNTVNRTEEYQRIWS